MVRKNSLTVKIIFGIAVAVGGWAAFNLIRLALETTLVKIGIVTELQQAAVLVVLVFVVLIALGLSFKKAILKLFG